MKKIALRTFLIFGVGFCLPLQSSTYFIGYISHVWLIQNGQKLEIQYLSNGSFHNVKETLIVKRKKDKYYLNYQDSTLDLSIENVKKISSFEEDIYYREFGTGCTTTDKYLIIFKKDTVVRNIDASCEWDGWQNLLNDLGLSKG